jgi:hypothetical protein
VFEWGCSPRHWIKVKVGQSLDPRKMNDCVNILPKEISVKDLEFFVFQDKVIGFDTDKYKFLLFRKFNLQNLKEYSCVYGNYIIKNGNLIIASFLDPIFLLVNLYEKLQKESGSMFYSLENLFVPVSVQLNLDRMYTLEKLEKVFDTREISSEIFVKLNQEKFLDFLLQKLKDKDSLMCLKLLKEYVNSEYLEKLKEILNIKQEKVEYYVEQVHSTKKRSAKESVKESVKQVKKKKVTGMKSITSFFQKV